MPEPKSILVLYYHHGTDMAEMRFGVSRNVRCLEYGSVEHDIMYYNASREQDTGYSCQDLHGVQFDVIILHSTFLCARCHEALFPFVKSAFDWIRDCDCVRIALPQDEYDHSEVLGDWLCDWNVHVVFSVLSADNRTVIYPRLTAHAEFHECLCGYVDDVALKSLAPTLMKTPERPIDIAYRATRLPLQFGSHGQMKYRLAEAVGSLAATRGLVCDISTDPEAAIMGNDWLRFLAGSKATIGCESGSSVLDRRGEIHTRLELLRMQGVVDLQETAKYMPEGWDNWRFFAISPRHFEAAMTRTAQILVRGKYSGILEADRHYIPLDLDFSNIDTVLEKAGDTSYLDNLAQVTYKDICLSGNYSYRTFANSLNDVIHEHCPSHKAGTRKDPGMSKNDRSSEALEQCLLAERHRNDLLQLKLQRAEREIGRLTGLLQVMAKDDPSRPQRLLTLKSDLNSSDLFLAWRLMCIAESKPFDVSAGIALYGAGKHTLRLLKLDILPAHQISVIFDDSPSVDTLEGIPVVSTDQNKRFDFDMLVLSSDTHEDAMAEKAESWLPAGKELVRIYGGRP